MIDTLPIEIIEKICEDISFIDKIFLYTVSKKLNFLLKRVIYEDIDSIKLLPYDIDNFEFEYVDIILKPELYEINDKNIDYFIISRKYNKYDDLFIMKNIELFIKYDRYDILFDKIINIIKKEKDNYTKKFYITNTYKYITKYNKYDMFLLLYSTFEDLMDYVKDIMLLYLTDERIFNYIIKNHHNINYITEIYCKFIRQNRINQLKISGIDFYYWDIIESFLILFTKNKYAINSNTIYLEELLKDFNINDKYNYKNKYLYDDKGNMSVYYYFIGYLSIISGEKVLKFFIDKGYKLDKYFICNYFNTDENIRIIKKYGKVMTNDIDRSDFAIILCKYRIYEKGHDYSKKLNYREYDSDESISD